MKLNTQTVSQIAFLASLAMTDEEKKMYAEQLSVVLDYIEELNQVDTNLVEETNQVTGLYDIFREDLSVDTPDDIRKKLRSQFPEVSGQYLQVKKVFLYGT